MSETSELFEPGGLNAPEPEDEEGEIDQEAWDGLRDDFMERIYLKD